MSFKDADFIYVLLKDNLLVGLIVVKLLSDKPKIGTILEMILSPAFRNSKLSIKLYELIFKNQDFDGITSYSKAPGAVKSRLKVGEKYGYETVFGDIKSSNPNISKLQNLALEYFKSEGIVSEVIAPKGYIYLKGELNINEPLKDGEARFDEIDPLYKPFKRILEIQKQNPKDTAVGILVSLKK